MSTHFFQDRPFAKGALLVIPIMLCVFVMGKHFPQVGVSGFSKLIIAFEFAKTTGDIHQILGPLQPAQIDGIDRGNYVDFAFMLFYAAFIFLFFKVAKTVFGIKELAIGQVLAVVIFFSDMLENMQLLHITKAYRGDSPNLEIDPFLFQLQLFTWLKWLGLGLALLLASFGLQKGDWVAKMMAVICVFPFLLSIIALITGATPWIERFTQSIFIGLAGLMIASFFIRPKS
ncbi:MAG: hypothetical protein R2828_17590 [Saprospiraceae bacterium]